MEMRPFSNLLAMSTHVHERAKIKIKIVSLPNAVDVNEVNLLGH